MKKRLGVRRCVLLGGLGMWLVACSLDSELPTRSGSPPPVTSGVTLSGPSAQDAGGAGYGEPSRISNISHADASTSPPTVAGPDGALDSKGALPESPGNGGGATSVNHLEGESAGAGGDAGSGGDSSVARELPVLWFSEYVEGSSSNKALEITTPVRAVLDGCKVATYFNGKTEATNVATLSGVLEAGQVLTLCTSALKEKLAATCNQVGNLTFNGDDAIALSCDGTVLDVIGQIGSDPGEAWGSEANTTADHTLRRKCSVTSGDPLGSDAFNPSTDWDALPVDTFDGLGARGC